MTIEQELIYKLMDLYSDGSIFNLSAFNEMAFGHGEAFSPEKIFFVRAPKGHPLPYLTINRISGVRMASHDGPNGSVESRFQISVFAPRYELAKTLAAVVYHLQDYTSGTVAKVSFIGETDLFENDLKSHHTALDFIIRHYE